jgi:hypothetical protein
MSKKIRVSSPKKGEVFVSENKSNNISVSSESNSDISIQEGQTINVKDISVTLSEFIQDSISAPSDSIGLTKNVTYTGSSTVESIISDMVSTSDVDIDLQVELECIDDFHPGRRGVLNPLRSRKFVYGDLYMLHGLKIQIDDTHGLLSDNHQMYLISEALDIEEAISTTNLTLDSWSDNNGSLHIFSGSPSLKGSVATFFNQEFPWPATPEEGLIQYLDPRGRFLRYGDDEKSGSYDTKYDIDFKVKMTKIIGGQEVEIFSNECVFSFVKLTQLAYTITLGSGLTNILHPYLQAPAFSDSRPNGSASYSLFDVLATDENDFNSVTGLAPKYTNQRIAPNFDGQVIEFEHPNAAPNQAYFGYYQQGYIAVPYPYAIDTKDPSSVMFRGMPVGNSLWSVGFWRGNPAETAITAEFDEGESFDTFSIPYQESILLTENQLFHELNYPAEELETVLGSDRGVRLNVLANTALVNLWALRHYGVRLYAFSQLRGYLVGDKISVRFTKVEVPVINIDTDDVFSTFVESDHRFRAVRGLGPFTGGVQDQFIDPASETKNLVLENGYNNYGSSAFADGDTINVDIFKNEKFENLSLSVSNDPINAVRIKKPSGTFASSATEVLSQSLSTDGSEEGTETYSINLPSLTDFNGVGTPGSEIYRSGTRVRDVSVNYKFECVGLKDSPELYGIGAYNHHVDAEGVISHEIRTRSFMFVSNLDVRSSIANAEGVFRNNLFEGNLDFAVPSGNYVNMDGQKVSSDPEDGTGHSNRFMHYIIAGSSSGGSTPLSTSSDALQDSSGSTLTFSTTDYGLRGYFQGTADSDIERIACRHAIDADTSKINFKYSDGIVYTASFESSKNTLSEVWVPHYEGATNIQRYPGALVKAEHTVFQTGGSGALKHQRWERNNLTGSSAAFLYRAVPYRLLSNPDAWMYTNDNGDVVTRYRVQNTSQIWVEDGLTIHGVQFPDAYVSASVNNLSDDEADDEMVTWLDPQLNEDRPVTFTMTNQYGKEEEYVLFQSLTEMTSTPRSGPVGPIFNYQAHGFNP